MRVEQKGPLSSSIQLYLAHKRSLGKQLAKTEPMLYLLNRYLHEQGVAELHQISPEQIERFVASRPRHSPRSYNVLIGMLRGLFDWLVVHEFLSHSPVKCRPRRVKQTRRPFLFTPQQIRVLLEAAGQLPENPRAQSRGVTYKMIFSLLYGLGLRVGEAARLRRTDVDLVDHLLVIRQTKFRKDRLVPFGPRMARVLTDFLERKESRSGPIAPEWPLFSFAGDHRAPIQPKTISQTFHNLMALLQLSVPSGVEPPRAHCLRHSFAVGTLLRWYRTGVDPMSRLFDLATFLGHVSPSSTALYLTITDEILTCASQRFADFAATSRKEYGR